MNQLYVPNGIYIDDDQTIYIADSWNDRIVEWKLDAKNGKVVAGGNRRGNRNDQLFSPVDVVVDKENDSLIICDHSNKRVVRWPRRNGKSGEIIISNINCHGLAMDNERNLYVVDWIKPEVRKWRIGDTNGTVVAGENGQGSHLNQLVAPKYIFVDRNHSVYVSDWDSYGVMKWMKDAKEGIIIVRGIEQFNHPTQMNRPSGVIVDQFGHAYIVDTYNHRVMRWINGAAQGSTVVGGNGQGIQPNQLNNPWDLSFDRHGNLYVADSFNHRVQKFEIDSN